MEKDILITFKGLNRYIDGESDSAEFMTRGTLYKKNDKYYIKYTEVLGDCNDAYDITMKFENSRATIMRFGEFSTQLTLEIGKKHVNYYETPHGSLIVGVIAESVFIDVGGSEGNIKLFYNVEINNAPSSKNSIVMSYKEIGGNSNE